MPERTFDIAIVGGGIVGSATAMALTDPEGPSICILEAENHLAAHQTGNNSGVIHSGLYYKPGSLKAVNCSNGRQAMYRFCEEQGIAHERCGKLVIAVTADEIPKLDALEQRGIANGLTGLKRIPGEQIPEFEPNARGLAGMVVPETGIVDYTEVTNAFARIVRSRGGEIRLGSRVTACRKLPEGLLLTTSSGELLCRNLINCSGLQSDRIARMCGVEPNLQIIPFRGEYYTLRHERRNLVRNLIYPVPDPRFPFLGVHYTRRVNGEVEAGPNAVLAFKREGYTRSSFSFRDTSTFFMYPGFWLMSLNYWKMGLGEFHRSFSKSAFVRALKGLTPSITGHDIQPGGAGVRAQALERNGFLVDDFRIVEAPNMIHVLNAPSPAATASISIGRTIAEMARKRFAL